jgi:hypothetical protein
MSHVVCACAAPKLMAKAPDRASVVKYFMVVSLGFVVIRCRVLPRFWGKPDPSLAICQQIVIVAQQGGSKIGKLLDFRT